MESKDTFKDLQFDGKPSGYRDFRRKTILAVAGLESRNVHLAGPRLLQRLQGEAWRATEHLRIADLRAENGWMEVIQALDLHYKFLPETELHEAVEEFLFAMKRRQGEGATSFSSRFRTQLDRVQTLIAQERASHRAKRRPRRGRKQAPVPVEPLSSLDDSEKSQMPEPQPPEPEQGSAASHQETGDETGREEAPRTSADDAADQHSVHTGRSQAPSAAGSKTSSKRERESVTSKKSQLSRGTHKSDRDRQNRRMLEMLGSLEQGHLRPTPIFPQAILGHLYMRKFGLTREQRAHIIRSTNGSSRLEDVERIVRASDLEEFRHERREERRPAKLRRETYAVQAEPQHVMVANDDASSSSLYNPEEAMESSSEEILAAEDDGETDQELQECYEVQKRAKKEFRKQFKTYKESRKKVREIKKTRTPYMPVVALNQDGSMPNQMPVVKQNFGYERKPQAAKTQPKRKPDSKFQKKEEANLATSSTVTQFSYMVSACTDVELSEDVWLMSVPVGFAVLDTGCTTSLIGMETAESLTKHMASMNWPPPTPCQLPPVELKGFSGNRVQSTEGLKWHVKLGSLWGTITTYVIQGSAPFLLSRRVLEGMKAQLDMGRHTITSDKHELYDVPLRQASNGHLLLPLVTQEPDLTIDHEECAQAEHYIETNEPNPCPEHSTSPLHSQDQGPISSCSPKKVTTSDRRRTLQHIVKNTRKGVVNVERFRSELITIFGKKGQEICHAFVAYRPRLERMPPDADTNPYLRSVASLTEDGVFHVSPWGTRNAGAVRRPVSQVNICLFAFVAEADPSPEHTCSERHHDHTCFCCRECDSEGDNLSDNHEEKTEEVDTEILYGDDVDWTDVSRQSLSKSEQNLLRESIKKLRSTYGQFLMTRLMGDRSKVVEELTEWLGPQAAKLKEQVSMIEVFTGAAPLAAKVEQLSETSCIRIGLEYGHDLNRHDDRRKLLLLIAFCKPDDVWISFPCGCWGPWSRMNMHLDEVRQQHVLDARRLAKRHLSIVPEVWTLQQSLGGHTHIENPLTSDAWKEFRLPNAYVVRIDQCSVGLRCPKTNKPVLKPTKIVTSCQQMANRLVQCRCDHRHDHAHLEGNFKGKPLTSYAETYPRKMCRVVAEVMCARRPIKRDVNDVFAEFDESLEPVPDADAVVEPPPDAPIVPVQRLKSMIRKLHVNTGHASNEQMLRLATRCQVSQEVKDVIKEFRCAICDEHKVPSIRRQATIPHAESPNQIVGIDYVQVELKHLNDRGRTVETKFNVLTCVDLASDFAQQIIVHKGTKMSQAFHEVWTRPFGAPKIIYTDPQSASLSADFQHYMLTHGIQLLHCGAESHWQLGRVEVANRVLRGMAQRVWQDTARPPAEVIETCASIRNQHLRKHGFSPSQWFLGQDVRHAAMLHDVDEQRNYPVQSQVVSDPVFSSKVQLREAAAKAFLEEHSKDAWRRALAGKNRPMRGPYQQGQLVYFFRKRARGLLSTRHGVWYGPGKIIGLESSTGSVVPRIVWVAFNGFIYKCSPEGLRPVTEDEQQFRELARELMQGRLDPSVERAEQELSSRCPQYQDLSQDIPEDTDMELEQDIMEEPDEAPEENEQEEEGGPRKVRRRFYRSPEYWQKRAAGMPPLGTLQEGPMPVRVGPQHQEPNYEGEPPSKRRAVLEDIPEEDEQMPGLSTPQNPPEVDDDSLYSPSIAPDPVEPQIPPDDLMELPEPLNAAIPPESETPDEPSHSAPLDEALPEITAEQQLDQAAAIPVPDDDDENLMVEVQDGKCKRSESVLEVSLNVCRDDITSDPLCLWHVLEDCFQVSIPKAKLRRVEVSYRRLSDQDKELFKKAMQKEWQSWIDNKVTSLCKRQGISPERIIRARWVLTWKKSSDPDDRSKVPKARLVLIGWEDPELGKIATDSPTLRKESKHLVLSICASKRWKVFGADIKTAFLSGDRTQREIYFKPPPELREWLQLSTDDLFRLEKAAYGLAEAPRAWFLRLSRELREVGLTQSQLDPCLFTLRSKNQIIGVCGIHVDDLLGGGTPAMDEILNKLRSKLPFGDYRTFTIRYTGIEIRQNPQTYEIEIGQETYIDALEVVQTKPLGTANTALPDRSLLRTCAGQLAWVSNATRPDQAFLSSYLQGVQDTGKVAHVHMYNKSVREMKEKKVCVRFPSTVPIEDWRLICVCDAGWATRENGDSQGGYLLLLCESKMLKREQAKCWLVDWSSKKLKRAVRSSVAAETLAGQNGLDAVEFFQALLEETLRGVTPRQFREMTPKDQAGIVIDSKGFYDAITRSCCSQAISVERRLQIDYAIAKETMNKQNILAYWINNLRMAADCLTKLRGESKLLYEILEQGVYQIKVCTVSGRREKAGEGQWFKNEPTDRVLRRGNFLG